MAPGDAVKPRLVLLHGSLSSAQQWEGYAKQLPGIEVVAIDFPGHGARAGEAFSTGAAIKAIGEAVHPSAPTVLAGHSLGGYMASAYVHRHPGQLAGLVLLGASADPTSPLAGIYRAYAWLVGKVAAERLARVRNRLARRLGVAEASLPPASAYEVLVPSWRAVWEDCSPDLLRGAECPVLFINGQFDQMRMGERRYQKLTGGELVIVPRASHLAPMTHPHLVIGHLYRFVRACAASRSV